MAEVQLFFIGTSTKTEVRMGGAVTYNWGSYGAWTKFKNPVAKSAKLVKYNKTTKSKAGASQYGGVGGVTKLGTSIPATAKRTIDGVEMTVDVRYWQRGYTIIKRDSTMKKMLRMAKLMFTKDKPYQYRLQYKDKAIYEKEYSQYVDGTEYVYFADHYYVGGVRQEREGHLPHPSDISFQYSDVRKNFDLNANNSESRDNYGKYVMSNVRSNIMTMQLTWTGLSAEEGADLLATLNPGSGKNYLIVQYWNPASQKAKNGTFYADPRTITKYPNGLFKEISVTLTEV